MIKHGVNLVIPDKRDYDFHRTFAAKVGSLGIFPDSLNLDAGLTMPDQNTENTQFNPAIPALPEGCTDYAQSELKIDQTKQLWSPMLLENVTHANANGGCDIRVSLAAALSVYDEEAYFAVTLVPGSDWFDSIRAALYASERSISIVTPWYREWENPPSTGFVPIPANPSEVTGLPWHNHKIPGWIPGGTRLLDKSWQGNQIGDQGWLSLDRPTINAVMAVSGTGAFTIAPKLNATLQTILIGDYEQVVADLEQIL